MTIEKQQELVRKLLWLRNADVKKFEDTMLEVSQAVSDDVQKVYGTILGQLLPFYIYEFECAVKILKDNHPDEAEAAKALHKMIRYTAYSSETVEDEENEAE